MEDFRERLAARQRKINSLVCVGLDPLMDKMPKILKTLPGKKYQLYIWMKNIIDATAPYTSMYKLQRAHWESIPDGETVMRDIIKYIKKMYPDILIFLDVKRGDIGRTQARYRIAHFELDGADAINFAPYMGEDCMEHLVDPNHLYRGIVGLCYTSNPKARNTQDKRLESGYLYWEFIALEIMGWAEKYNVGKNAGLVMAAAHQGYHPDEIHYAHLSRCRELVGNKLWFLIPGIGTQKGFVLETVKHSYVGPGSIAINSSSAIIFASDELDYNEAAGEAAKRLKEEINAALKQCHYKYN